VGVILLLNNLGELDWWVWADILSLWPLILIAIGIEKIFSKSKAEFIAYLPILALAGVVIWVAVEGFDGDDSYLTRRGSTYRYTVDIEPGVERIQAKFNLDDVDVSLNNTGNRLFRARSDGWRRVPKVEFDEIGGVAELEISPRRNRMPNWIRIDNWGRSGDWDLYLSDQVPVSLECYGDESDMNLDCRDLLLEKLYVNSEQGDIRIRLGDLKGLIEVKLEGTEADYRISIPDGSNIRISEVGDKLGRFFERKGLVEDGVFYKSAEYDSLAPRIELILPKDLTQFSLDYH
jgi:hypothetical protein